MNSSMALVTDAVSGLSEATSAGGRVFDMHSLDVVSAPSIETAVGVADVVLVAASDKPSTPGRNP
ncbi:hypothetical protein HUA76_42035 [Myxococcus sp. CA056]|uniref:hypothetical protein n=1 Tax=unclassified Myxococcus TaxID=2648731 RepID=UPI00157ABA6F|nr:MULTISPECIES: hypothetical protein [unclassified Myxococcus]NTX17370.1 hypothetical protein [Myxococcus sp. CA056]NTX56860.1 hypothetical protein [Myxococcus sp. CA039A]